MSLITDNLDLVFNLAKSHAGQDYAEYLASGYIGMTEAAASWNAEMGASFRTHAHNRVRGAMLDQDRPHRSKNRKDGGRLKHEPIDDYAFVSVDALPDDFTEVLTKDMPPRVRMVAAMAADGFQQQDIAHATGYCASTVRNDLNLLKLKLER